ncbi:HNH endonuclease, partial [Ancrocorticia sp.]|uniref:HNH endonuclease signature motif containing protein n=1 Tax=Ancrocorticia sp. TaxID=2593684 RepID=UPI003F9231E2
SDGTPLAPTQLAELLCDSDIARVVLTAHGEPIDTSRSQRLFSGRQARAVAARDRSCRYPGCSRGIEVSQIHHAQQWEKGGPTTMDNAVLLCFHHHRYVHSKQVIITHHAGGFTFTEPSGELVGITHHTTILEAA